MAWQRWNSSTKIFEYSTNNGVTWSPLVLDAAVITQGTIDAARLPAISTLSGTLGLAHGGTGVDLSASGGATKILAQDISHVISARDLISGDIPNLDTSKITTGQLDIGRLPSGGSWVLGSSLFITGGFNIGINTTSPDFGTGGAGIYLGIDGGASRGNVIIGSDQSCATAAANFLAGSLRFGASDNTTTASGQNLGTIDCHTTGASNKDRGGIMHFWNKRDGNTEVRQFTLSNNGVACFITDTTFPPTQLGNIAAGGGQVLSIIGTSLSSSNKGVLELATTAADADATPIGQVNFASLNNTSQPSVATILASTNGATANNRGGKLEFYVKTNGGAFASPTTIGNLGGMYIGAATGSDKGAGTLNVATGIYLNGTAFSFPDYVFEHYYTGKIKKFRFNRGASEYKGLKSLKEVRDFISKNYELPLMSIHKDGDLFERGDLLMASVEEAFLYIMEIDDRLSQLGV